jgi:hypothetical protein
MSGRWNLNLSWRRLFAQAVLAAFAYAFLEWLFFATMPSFMDALPLGRKLEIFLLTGLMLAAAALALLIPLRLLGEIPGPTKRGRFFQWIACLVPASIAAALSLLLIDNFTYTVFQFGIVTSRGAIRAGYAVLVVALLLLWYRWMLINAKSAAPKDDAGGRRRGLSMEKAAAWLAAALIALAALLGAARYLTAAKADAGSSLLTGRRPHIVLLSGEGLDSAFLSLYGYPQETTPNLEAIAETGLLAENNYTNAAHTTGSMFSMLTGKYPADTRLLYTPNILEGADAIEHLPGILQRAGYTTVQIAFPYYVDAYNVNMQEAFDEVNGRSLEDNAILASARAVHWEDAGYFLPMLGSRISDRLLHVFFVRGMPDPYRDVIQAVNPNTIGKGSDLARMGRLFRTLREAEGPVFAHVHLMDTHGAMFYPRQRIFSANQVQDREWMQVFYNDAVRDFDSYIGDFVQDLQSAGLWDDTLLIVCSDHTSRQRTNGRIPLLFHFPNGEYAGRIRNNTQNLDVAPTILDYLGLAKPAWMAGQSLLAGEPPALRPILSARVVEVDCPPPDWWCEIKPQLSEPPFYQFEQIQLVVCQEMYTLNLKYDYFSSGVVLNHTAPCPREDLPGPQASRRTIIEHLRANGFDVSSLE